MKEFYLVIIAVTATTTGVFSAEIPTACPSQDSPNKTIHIAHESDCSKFYKCLKGEKREMICPEYTKGERLCFNPETQICDWPWNVMCCKEAELPVDPHCPSVGDDALAAWPHPISCNLYFTCQNGIKSLRSCDKGELFDHEALECRPSGKVKCNKDVECPPAGSSEIVIVPHECICANYYECINGELVRKQCPSGMKFDYIRNECVLADEAVCNTGSSTVLPKPTPPTPAPVKCPRDGNEEIPHETDCSLYYKCENGTKSLEQCKNGFYFDEIMGMCTWWENVNCGSRLPDKNKTDEPTVIEECPPKGSHGNVTLPHECSCDKYYVCKDGEAVVHRCKEGTVYDYVNEVCGVPEVVNCERPVPELKTTPRKTPTDPGTTVSWLTTFTEPTCPATGFWHIADPSNRRWFYTCQNGHIVNHLPCLQNMCFDPTVGQCKEGGDCKDGPNNECPECLPLECKGIILPNPNDCSSFFQCVDGYKKLRKCRDGLLYNKDLHMCDYPQYVDCDDYKCTEASLPGETVPHECECYLYYECYGKDARRRECDEGYDYDYVLKRCVPKGEAKCYEKFSTNVFRSETNGQCIILENV